MSTNVKKVYFDTTANTIIDTNDTIIQNDDLFPFVTLGDSGAILNIQFTKNQDITDKYTDFPGDAVAQAIVDNDYSNPYEFNLVKTGYNNWVASGENNEYYYDGDLTISSKPEEVYINSVLATEGTKGSLNAGEWDWHTDNKLYVRITGDGDPDAQANGYVTYVPTYTPVYIQSLSDKFNQNNTWFDEGTETFRNPVLTDGEVTFQLYADTDDYLERISDDGSEASASKMQVQFFDASSNLFNMYTFSFRCLNRYLPNTYNPTTQISSYYTKTEIDAAFMSRTKFNLATASNLQISSGAVTRTSTVHTIEPETGTTDDLETINGGTDSYNVVLYPNDSADVITIKDSTGNIKTPNGGDYVLTGEEAIMMNYDGTNWRIVSSSGIVNLGILPAGVVDIAADSIAFIDASDSNLAKQESITDLATAQAGPGIGAVNGLLYVDLNEVGAEVMDVSADSIAFIDAGTNLTQKESWTDIATAIAGTNISASAGVLNHGAHTGDVTGSTALTITADAVNDTHIDWGTGANQVSAVDMPIADAGGIITATEVEGALQENRTAINLNTTHRSSDGSDHSYINQSVVSGSAPTFTADNFSDGGGNAIITTTQETNFEAAYTHVSSNGSDHSYINQSVTSGSSPTFDGANITGVDAVNVDIADAGGIITATDVEGALQENRTAIDSNTDITDDIIIDSTNTAIGTNAFASNTTGTNNVAVGANSLDASTTARYNTAVGISALSAVTTAENNVAVGRNALLLSTGASNTAVGAASLDANTTGTSNTAVGVNALGAITTYTNCTGLGSGAATTGSNQVQLGNVSTTTYAYGAVQDRSDRRDKTDIRDTVLGLNFLLGLRPVDFRWDMREFYMPERPDVELPEKPSLSKKASPKEKRQHKKDMLAYKKELKKYREVKEAWLKAVKLDNLTSDNSKKRHRYHCGLIAQEVKEVMDELGVDFGGYQDHKISGGQDVLSLGYSEFIPILIKAIQQLHEQIKELKK